MPRKLFVEDCGNIRLFFYLIGYPEKGESQILIIKDTSTNKILLSGVIDCYTFQGVNKTAEILKDEGILDLTFFFWTHTDEDHSLGTNEIIEKFCDNATLFFLPEGIYGNDADFVTYSEETKKALEKIKSFNSGTKYNVSSISTPVECVLMIESLTRIYTDKFTNSVTFQIKALAPIGGIIRRRVDNGMKIKNDSSIALLAQFGQFTLFLAGDIENITIQHIPSYHFENLTYLKTPHHTSISSDKLLNKFDTEFNTHKISITCSTVYEVHKLPDLNLIEDYKKYSHTFYSTGTGANGSDHGIIKVEFDDSSSTLYEELIGNAEQVF